MESLHRIYIHDYSKMLNPASLWDLFIIDLASAYWGR